MAYRRHTPPTVSSSSSNTPPTRRKFIQRRPISSRKPSLSSTGCHDDRPVLVPLIQNLRRLPSRTYLKVAPNDMSRPEQQIVRAGTKRKRVESSNENTRSDGRARRGSSRTKRYKRSVSPVMDYSSDEGASSSMEVDALSAQSESEEEENAADTDEDDSTEDYLINSAPASQLQRLRKDELVRLYTLAGLTDDAESFTKSDIIDCIVAVRDEVNSLPPSSPPGRGSDCSSDEGQDADSEEDDTLPDLSSRARLGNPLRRRATTTNVSSSGSRPSKQGRSYSLGDVLGSSNRKSSRKSPTDSGHKRTGARPSPANSLSSSSTLVQTPIVNRLRSRKASGPEIPLASMSTPVARKSSSRDSKSIDSSGDADMVSLADESDLTELDSDADIAQPSPRRLRSKDRELGRRSSESIQEELRRITPKRKAKERIQSLAEEDSEDAMGDSADEVDELISSTSTSTISTPTVRPRRTPIKRRLRSQQAEDAETSVSGDEEEQGTEGDEEDKAPTIVVEPRKLRNGKIVGEDAELEGEDELVAEDEEDIEQETDEAESSAEMEGDSEAEDDAEEDDVAMEDEVDLSDATVKTLTRLRRENLVQLCESRELDVSGTKPQLAASLLQWRDQRGGNFSSPSSTGTIRPPSTLTRSKTRRGSGGKTPPVLLRSQHVHMDEPLTPLPVSEQGKGEQELELDLGELGLEDREIPPEKLTKLEKIGSGGFKDVYIGKFKGRKIAISEFRGHLTAMDIKELKLLGVFNHPNIVKFLGVSIPENNKETPVMIISELCSNGDLFDYVRNVNPPTLHKILNIMLDIARGLAYLHNQKPSIIHRDCKSSNILISSRGVAKIADFGLARVKQSTRSAIHSLVGTVNWQAPELWHAHPKYNHKVDVFSAAMVYWEMMQWHIPNKQFPWEGMNEHAIYDVVGAKRQRPSIVGLRKQYCGEIVDLMEEMWAHDHQDRPDMDTVVETLEGLVQKYR